MEEHANWRKQQNKKNVFQYNKNIQKIKYEQLVVANQLIDSLLIHPSRNMANNHLVLLDSNSNGYVCIDHIGHLRHCICRCNVRHVQCMYLADCNLFKWNWIIYVGKTKNTQSTYWNNLVDVMEQQVDSRMVYLDEHHLHNLEHMIRNCNQQYYVDKPNTKTKKN